MLKDMKNLFAILSLLFFASGVWAQECVPDNTLTEPGFYPEDLMPAVAGEAYEMVLQVRSISDTVVQFAGNQVKALIDSIQLTGVLGLPAGFSYSCFTPNCTFLSSETRCAKLTGQPRTEDVGTYPLEFPIIIYARVGVLRIPQPDTIRTFTLYVTNGTASIRENSELPQTDIFPNPARNEVNVKFTGAEMPLKVYTLQGQKIYDRVLKGSARIDVSEWSSGVYLFELPDAASGTLIRKKVVIAP